VLSQHPSVSEVIVVAREDVAEEVGMGANRKSKTRNLKSAKRLVAYMVLNHDTGHTRQELLSFLKRKLPDYMVPSAFVFLDSPPLTPSGKVDRRGLPAPGQNRPELEGDFVGPRTSTEEVIARIWTDLLNLEEVGIYDNFFDLGGHSLLATRVISRIRDVYEVEMPLRVLFEAPTVSGLAEAVQKIFCTKPLEPSPQMVAPQREYGEL
jgi:acyl carrier protein